jgi:hypothetical protein
MHYRLEKVLSMVNKIEIKEKFTRLWRFTHEWFALKSSKWECNSHDVQSKSIDI